MASDEPLIELRDLPRIGARPGFTRAVLTRLERPAHRSSLPRYAIAFAATLIVAVLAVEGHRSRQNREAMHQDLLELRQELQMLERTLPPVDDGIVLVGGSESVDYVIDLRPERAGAAPAGLEATYY